MRGRFFKRLRDSLKGVHWSSAPEGIALDGIIVLVFVAVVGIACFSPWPWDDSPWVALAAAATFFAAVVALWLGWREGVWRRQEAQEKHARADILLAMQTGVTGQALEMILGVKNELLMGEEEGAQYHNEIAIIFRAVETLRQIDHVHLLRVDQEAGICLARCIGNLNGLAPILGMAERDQAAKLMAIDCLANAHRDLSAVIQFLYDWPDNPLKMTEG